MSNLCSNIKAQPSFLLLIAIIVGLSHFSSSVMAVSDFVNASRLAEQGDAQVQFELGRMFMNGTGVERDDEKAQTPKGI